MARAAPLSGDPVFAYCLIAHALRQSKKIPMPVMDK